MLGGELRDNVSNLTYFRLTFPSTSSFPFQAARGDRGSDGGNKCLASRRISSHNDFLILILIKLTRLDSGVCDNHYIQKTILWTAFLARIELRF